MPLAAARLARRLSSMEWLLLWLRAAFQRCAANVCKKQMKTNVFPATAMHHGFAARRKVVAVCPQPTQNARESANGTSAPQGASSPLVGRFSAAFSDALKRPAARACTRTRSHEHEQQASEEILQLRALHRANQCSVAPCA